MMLTELEILAVRENRGMEVQIPMGSDLRGQQIY